MCNQVQFVCVQENECVFCQDMFHSAEQAQRDLLVPPPVKPIKHVRKKKKKDGEKNNVRVSMQDKRQAGAVNMSCQISAPVHRVSTLLNQPDRGGQISPGSGPAPD